jgi:hypothetical protein
LEVFYASYADSVEHYLEKDVFRNTVIAPMEPHHFPKDRFLVLRVMQDLDTLVNRIYDYTIRLAENNKVELTEEELSKTDNSILNLQNYLKTQKRIFETAA